MQLNWVPREPPCCWWGSIYTPTTKTSRWGRNPPTLCSAGLTGGMWPVRPCYSTTARKLAVVVLSEGPVGLAGQTEVEWPVRLASADRLRLRRLCIGHPEQHHPGLQGAGLTAHVPPVRPALCTGQTAVSQPVRSARA